MREELIGDCRLILGDCLEVIKNLPKVDAIVTDPPYGIETIVKRYGRNQGKLDKTIANDKNLDVTFAALTSACKLLKPDYLLAFYSPRNEVEFRVLDSKLDLDLCGSLVWNKKAPGLGSGLRYQHENIIIYKSETAPPHEPLFSVLSVYRDATSHPHQKPVPLMEKLCQALPAPTILDPFMGTGTTGVACVKLGRKFIGIEINKKYFDIACERVREAYAQADLFIKPPENPEQLELDQESEQFEIDEAAE